MKAELSVNSDEMGSPATGGPVAAPTASPAAGPLRVGLTRSRREAAPESCLIAPNRVILQFFHMATDPKPRNFAIHNCRDRSYPTDPTDQAIRNPQFAICNYPTTPCGPPFMRPLEFHLIPLSST